MKMQPLVSLIIPSYNGKKMLIDLLESIKKVTYKNYEIVVVDNGSMDGTYEYVKTNYPYVKIVRIVKNRGFTGAMNSGIKHSKGKYIVLLNNDVIVFPNWLSELVEIAESDKTIGLVGNISTSKDIDFVRLGYVETNKIFVRYKPLDIPKKKIRSVPRVVEVDNIQFGLIKKEVLKRTGLFDEKYLIYWSEIELCYKAKKLGYKIVTATRSKIWHYGSSTMKKTPYIKTYDFYKSKIRFILKNLEPFRKITTLSLTLMQFFVEIMRHTIRGDFDSSLAIINGIFWNIRNFRDYI